MEAVRSMLSACRQKSPFVCAVDLFERACGEMRFAGMPAPDEADKPNQDTILMAEHPNEDVDAVLLGVFDGHGEQGHRVSQVSVPSASSYAKLERMSRMRLLVIVY